MISRPFGKTDRRVSVIGQGTWNIEKGDPESAVRTLRRGIELGLTHIDTAELYGSGKVEELTSQAIEGKRDQVFLASKVHPSNSSYEGTLKACEQSLKRLKTDYLDLYLLHWPGSHPFSKTIEAFEELKESGKIRAYGVSNFSAEHLGLAVRIAGKGSIACNQVLYHLEERTIEHEVVPLCDKYGIAVVGYSPFGQQQFDAMPDPKRKVLEKIAKAHEATSRQVALAFLTRRESFFTIPKASSIPHVEENAGGDHPILTQREIKDIEKAFPVGRKTKNVPTL